MRTTSPGPLLVCGAVIAFACVTAAAGSAWAADASLAHVAPRDAGTDHDVHVSVSRVAVDGNEVFWRIRCFTDDLELALRRQLRDSTFTFARARETAADSLVLAYARQHLQLQADGVSLPVRLVSSGTEADESGEQVRWYVLQFTAPKPPLSLRIRHAMLSDVYRDQQNLVTLMHSATNRRLPLYFTAGNDIAQTVTFDAP